MSILKLFSGLLALGALVSGVLTWLIFTPTAATASLPPASYPLSGCPMDPDSDGDCALPAPAMPAELPTFYQD
jgi:hypothetical protein